MDQRFTKKERLLKRKEFQRVFDNGKAYGNDQVKIYALLNDDSISRLDLVVGRKFGTHSMIFLSVGIIIYVRKLFNRIISRSAKWMTSQDSPDTLQ